VASRGRRRIRSDSARGNGHSRPSAAGRPGGYTYVVRRYEREALSGLLRDGPARAGRDSPSAGLGATGCARHGLKSSVGVPITVDGRLVACWARHSSTTNDCRAIPSHDWPRFAELFATAIRQQRGTRTARAPRRRQARCDEWPRLSPMGDSSPCGVRGRPRPSGTEFNAPLSVRSATTQRHPRPAGNGPTCYLVPIVRRWQVRADSSAIARVCRLASGAAYYTDGGGAIAQPPRRWSYCPRRRARRRGRKPLRASGVGSTRRAAAGRFGGRLASSPSSGDGNRQRRGRPISTPPCTNRGTRTLHARSTRPPGAQRNSFRSARLARSSATVSCRDGACTRVA